jgi:DNA-binding GntR family transcriptional regulator
MVRLVGLSQETTVATAAERLLLALDDANAMVIRIKRLRYADDRLLSYEEVVLPSARMSHDGDLDLSLDIADLARQRGLTLGRATEFVLTVSADPVIAARLGVAVGTRVMKLDRIATTADGLPIEWRVAYSVQPS